MTPRAFRFWTTARRIELVDLRAKGWTHDQCARYFGCKRQSVEGAWGRIRKERGDPPRTMNTPSNTNRRTDCTRRMASAVVTAKVAREHLPPPATLTAWLCGDPLPGRSALDRKRSGADDDGQAAGRANRITLAMEPMRCL